jgi:TolB-like protein
MKKNLFAIILILLLSFPAFSKDPAIAILDFEIQSENEKYKFLGKGFAEFISVELSQANGIKLVEREKRNEILNEINFGLSGLADENNLVELGNLLLANYIIAGQIFDMDGLLVVTSRLIDVESGQVKAYASSEGSMSEYKKITQDLTVEILNALHINNSYVVQDVTSAENDEIVLASFSEAVDAYDTGDDDLARKKLDVASAFDKTNKAVKKFSNKLNIISPKFQFEDPLWQTSYNPALSAFLDSGILYIRGNIFAPWLLSSEGITYDNHTIEVGTVSDPDYTEPLTMTTNAHVGYNFPVGQNFGVNTEISVIYPGEEVLIFDDGIDGSFKNIPVIIDGENKFAGAHLRNNEFYLGITGGLSYKASEIFSFGINASVFIPLNMYDLNGISYLGIDEEMINPHGNVVTNKGLYTTYALPDKIGFVINPGIICKFLNDRLFVDLNVAIPISVIRYYYNIEQNAFINGNYPIFISSSITGSIIDNRLFLGLKSKLDIFTDSEANGIFLKESPVIEFWPFKFLSFRAGYIFSLLNLNSKISTGHGFLAGLTIKTGAWDFDLNYNQWSTPLYSVEGALQDSWASFLFSVTYNNMFPRRK